MRRVAVVPVQVAGDFSEPDGLTALAPSVLAVEVLEQLRAPTSEPAEQPLGVREVAGFPMRLLTHLPDAMTLACEVEDWREHEEVGGQQRVVFTTSRVAYEAARAAKLPIFIGGELGWLALAAEHDRAAHVQMVQWVLRKLALPMWKLDGRAALGDIGAVPAPMYWEVGRVFDRLGLELVAVGSGDEVPL